jgi:metal-dependent amidase/aminoacylase/carboxypeptidase family protein
MDYRHVIDQYRPQLKPFEDVYRDIHQNPELSKQEVRTANIAASHLESLNGFIVHRAIGGHGVVGVLRNGPGPTVLLRADMDALPHLENTGLKYASTKVAIGNDGKETPVMHACGHDM